MKTTEAVEEFETEKEMLDFIDDNSEDSLAVISLFRPTGEEEDKAIGSGSSSNRRRRNYRWRRRCSDIRQTKDANDE